MWHGKSGCVFAVYDYLNLSTTISFQKSNLFPIASYFISLLKAYYFISFVAKMLKWKLTTLKVNLFQKKLTTFYVHLKLVNFN